MAERAGGGQSRACDAERFRQPLDEICAEHARQRRFCELLEEIAAASAFDPRRAQEVVSFLSHGMVSHLLDEEQDLFPLLRRRCTAEDAIEAVLTRLSRDQAALTDLAGQIFDGLARWGEGAIVAPADAELRGKLLELARRRRRHLALMNSILIPIARARLTRRDLESLARRMAARRGVFLPTSEDS